MTVPCHVCGTAAAILNISAGFAPSHCLTAPCSSAVTAVKTILLSARQSETKALQWEGQLYYPSHSQNDAVKAGAWTLCILQNMLMNMRQRASAEKCLVVES